jgi:hypothetical protein
MSQDLRMTMSTLAEPGAEPRAEPEDEATPLPGEDEHIPRRETGLRIVLTILFVIIGGLLETLLAGIVIFELIVALGTQRKPSARVRELANRVISYYYRVGRYVTYNDSRVPFPFSDFPEALEADGWVDGESESKALGIPEFGPDDDGHDPYEDEDEYPR